MSSNTENNTTDMTDESAAEHQQLGDERNDQEQAATVDIEPDDSAEPDAATGLQVDADVETAPEAGAAVAQLAAELVAEGEAQVPVSDSPRLTIVPVEELSPEQVRSVVEAALFAADEALTLDRLFKLFVAGELGEEGGRDQVRTALSELEEACEGRGFELKKVASGYRMQVRQPLSPWVSRLWEEKPPRYTRALLETMALIAYKQPATRGDIEEVRGVAVSSNIMRTLLERGWIREVGQRDVPGRPSMYATTKEFLDYFNLSSLDQLPSLPEIRELVEPAQVPDEPVVPLVADAAGDSAAQDSAQDQEHDDQAEVGLDAEAGEMSAEVGAQDPVVDQDGDASGAAGDELQGVDAPDPAEGYNTSSAPVFADNEVLVVTESASVEVQQSSDLSPLSAADSQE